MVGQRRARERAIGRACASARERRLQLRPRAVVQSCRAAAENSQLRRSQEPALDR